jgi:hypothetical protein
MSPDGLSLKLRLMEITPFTTETVPPLGTAIKIAQDGEKPTGERLVRGESAVITEHVLAKDGLVYIGARTADGRVLRASFREAFVGLPNGPM